MAITREAFLEILKDSYSAYYNIFPNDNTTELPLAFRADFYSRDERYWLTKSIPIWGNETNEFVYVFSAPEFDGPTVERCMDYVIENSLPRVKPHKEHQYTNFKALFISDSLNDQVRAAIEKRSFTKSYKFSLHGYSTLMTAAVDLGKTRVTTNKAGNSLVKYFRKLFDVSK